MSQRLLRLGQEHEACGKINGTIRAVLVIVYGLETNLGTICHRRIPEPTPGTLNVIDIDVDTRNAQALLLYQIGVRQQGSGRTYADIQ